MFPAGQSLVITKCLACLVQLLNPLEEMESHTDNFPLGLEFKPFLLRTKCSKASPLAVELSLICCPRALESQTVLRALDRCFCIARAQVCGDMLFLPSIQFVVADVPTYCGVFC